MARRYKEVDLQQYVNKGGWYIRRNKDSRLWEIVSEKGRILAGGQYTNRLDAEMALDAYLDNLEAKYDKVNGPTQLQD